MVATRSVAGTRRLPTHPACSAVSRGLRWRSAADREPMAMMQDGRGRGSVVLASEGRSRYARPTGCTWQDALGGGTAKTKTQRHGAPARQQGCRRAGVWTAWTRSGRKRRARQNPLWGTAFRETGSATSEWRRLRLAMLLRGTGGALAATPPSAKLRARPAWAQASKLRIAWRGISS